MTRFDHVEIVAIKINVKTLEEKNEINMYMGWHLNIE